MEPALLHLTLIGAVVGVVLAGDLAVAGFTVTCRAVVSAHRRTPTRIHRALVVAAMTTALVYQRPIRATAATPPPSVRIHDAVTSASLEISDPEIRVLADAGGMTYDGSIPPKRAPVLEYTVVPGDCLWRIARSMLLAHGVDPNGARIFELWTSIYDTNRTVIGDDPDLILPGQVLVIPPIDATTDNGG